jgi:hypothetical protein
MRGFTCQNEKQRRTHQQIKLNPTFQLWPPSPLFWERSVNLSLQIIIVDTRRCRKFAPSIRQRFERNPRSSRWSARCLIVRFLRQK